MIEPAEFRSRALAALNAHPFTPPWWLRNPHQQTFWGPIMRKTAPPPFRLERWDTPDGDFLRVHLRETAPGRPWLVQLHGLEGNLNSFYVGGLTRAIAPLGWNTLLMEFRGCGGELNRTCRAYHMGETSDLDFVLGELQRRAPGAPIYLHGVSLGGNVVAKWLGEQSDRVPAAVRGAVVVSAPFNPAISALHFHQILYGFYAWNFLRSLVPKAVALEQQFPGVYDVAAVKASRDFNAYDTLVTAKLHGFRDAVHYWETVGSHQFLEHIRVPTLLLSAADDPFNPPETLPIAQAEASPWLIPQFTTHGGHVGFVAGPHRPSYWAEEQAVCFLKLCEPSGRCP